ncbi:MAG TPA: hypothetical protein VH621_05795, partial [Nitrososphaera sp.]
ITNQLMDIKSPVIIIDSWDAIASFMDKEARLNNERVLQTWRERAGAKLIFISEKPDDTTLDFLVDGIVELRQSHHENTRIREIALLKLRGVRIDRPSFVYTLENSMFRSFAPYKTINLNPSNKIKSGTNILTPELVRSGYSRLDSALGGGFPRKGLVLLELDSHVNTSVAMAFLGGLVSNFVSSGNPVLFQPFDWMDPVGVMRYLQKLIPSGRNDLFKILWSKKVSGLAGSLIVPSEKQAPAAAAVEKMKKKYRGKVLLNIMGTDMLKKLNGGANLGGIPEELMSAARKGDLSIAVISRSQTDVLQYLSELSDVHLRILMINDTLFLQPLAPSSTLFALVLDDNHIELEPIV